MPNLITKRKVDRPMHLEIYDWYKECMSRFLIRNVCMSDLHDVHRLARMLNTMNLPNELSALRELIELSEHSFTGQVEANEREYLFVLEELASGQVIGTSQVMAQHGTRESPHIFYEVSTVEHYSQSMDLHFKHQVLRLRFNYEGPTEVGGLILDPTYRGVKEKLGRQLSFIRFLFIKMNRSLFRDRLLAELLPPLTENGESLLWEALGRRFTGLNYMEADHISRTNKEFIKSLFPSSQFYLTLFEAAVREVIGAVGKSSLAACKMLAGIGFEYQNHVDPFDGGPHYGAETDDVLPVRDTKELMVSNLPQQASLVAHFKNPFTSSASFRAVYGAMTEENMKLLQCAKEDSVWFVSLDA